MKRNIESNRSKARVPGILSTCEPGLDKPKRRALADDVSAVTSAFIENNILMKKFLTRFLYRRQDIEDVVQEAYLRAYKAEKEAVIDQPKAFLFRVARNIALNELKSKSHHITDYIEECDTQVLNHVTPTLEDELQAQQHLGLYCEAIKSSSAVPQG